MPPDSGDANIDHNMGILRQISPRMLREDKNLPANLTCPAGVPSGVFATIWISRKNFQKNRQPPAAKPRTLLERSV